jgi:hypothetical protein
LSPRLRPLQARLAAAMGDTAVVCLAGARRTGRTTLAQAVLAGLGAGYHGSFRDPLTLAEAAADPAGFLEGLPVLAVLDDVDRAPMLLPLLKDAADRGRRFLLTTSTPLPGLVRSLGRDLEAFTLWPLAQAEWEGSHPGLIDAGFQGDPGRLSLAPMTRAEWLERVLSGGYPEVRDLPPEARSHWFHGYLGALVQEHLRDPSELREVHHLIRLLTGPGADPLEARRCRERLAGLQVLATLPCGSGPPFRCWNDPALEAHVLGMAPAALAARPTLMAPLLETFLVMELVKSAPWSQSRPTLSVLRSGRQLLVLLEDHRRELVAFAADGEATVTPEALQGLRDLRTRVGARMRAGILLHAGAEPRAAGPGLWVLPFQALWAGR